MDWEVVAQVFVLATAVMTALAVLLGRSEWLLWLVLVGFGFGGFNVYAAQTVWFPSKIVLLGVSAHVAFRLRDALRAASSNVRCWLGLLLAWVVASLALSNLIEAPLAKEYEAGLQGSTLRPIVQTVTYLQYAALVLLPGLALRSERDVVRFWHVFAILAALLVAGALAQMGLAVAGIPFMPILRAHGEHSLVAAFQYGESIVLRAYSFSGEPKTLASFLVPLFFAILMLAGRRAAGRLLRSYTLLFGVATAILLTFSSSAFVGAMLAMIVLLSFPQRGQREMGRLVLALAVLAGVMAAASVMTGLDVIELVGARTVGRLQTEMPERREVAVLEYLLGDPVLWVTGVGPGMIVFHVPGFHYGQGVDALESGWLAHFAELGIVGLVFHALFVASTIFRARAAVGRLGPEAGIYLIAGIGALVAASCVHLGWNCLWMMCLLVGVLETSRTLFLRATWPRDVRPAGRVGLRFFPPLGYTRSASVPGVWGAQVVKGETY